MDADRFDPEEIDLTCTTRELWRSVRGRCYAKSGLVSVWGAGFAAWYNRGGRQEMVKASQELGEYILATHQNRRGPGRAKTDGRVVDKTQSLSFSVTEEERRQLESIMHVRGMTKRSDFLRGVIREFREVPADMRELLESNHEPDINDTIQAAAMRAQMAGLAGLLPSNTDYPGMTWTAYGAALVAVRTHMDAIRKGKLPMVEADVRAANLDPYGRQAWGLYTAVLPKFFEALFGLDEPPTVDIRYKPLGEVDKQHVGAIQGEVTAHGTVHLHGEDKPYMKINVKVGDTTLVVVGKNIKDTEVAVGMTVYAAGTVGVLRQRIMINARKYTVIRPGGFESLYSVADRWRLSEKVIHEAVAWLWKSYGTVAAVRRCPLFVAYLNMRRGMSVEDRTIKHKSGQYVIRDDRLRTKPDGEEALRECMFKWPLVMDRIMNVLDV